VAAPHSRGGVCFWILGTVQELSKTLPDCAGRRLKLIDPAVSVMGCDYFIFIITPA